MVSYPSTQSWYFIPRTVRYNIGTDSAKSRPYSQIVIWRAELRFQRIGYPPGIGPVVERQLAQPESMLD